MTTKLEVAIASLNGFVKYLSLVVLVSLVYESNRLAIFCLPVKPFCLKRCYFAL